MKKLDICGLMPIFIAVVMNIWIIVALIKF